MKSQTLFGGEKERAVSPVIGVILMVAITVILAAVIGTFVLGLGDQVQENAPNAQFTFDADESEVTITHQGGDNVDPDDLQIAGPGAGADAELDFGTDGDPISAGDSASLNIDGTDSGVTAGQEIRLVWSPAGADRSATLGTFDVPE